MRRLTTERREGCVPTPPTCCDRPALLSRTRSTEKHRNICTATTTGWSSPSMQAARIWSSAPCRPTNSSWSRSPSPRMPRIWTGAWRPWSRASRPSSTNSTPNPWPSASPSPARPTIRTASSAATCPTSPRSAKVWLSAPSSRPSSASRSSSTTTVTCLPTARPSAAHCPR